MTAADGARRIWIDLYNTPQALFFAPVIPRLNADLGAKTTVTLREKNETVEIARLKGIEGRVVGRDYEDGLRKGGAMAWRSVQLARVVPAYDLGLCFESAAAIPVSWMRRKPHILMMDNDLKFDEPDLAQRIETRAKMLASHVLVPEPIAESTRREFKRSTVLTFDGMKEHLTIAGFEPRGKPASVPFAAGEYAVVRPEILESRYVAGSSTITPEIVKGLVEAGIPVVLLDRGDRYQLAKLGPLVHIPPTALDGLQLMYHARTVLTGSGTMAREAAVLGVPAVSFFPGRRLLALDQRLVDAGRVFHSRDARAIVDHVKWVGNVRYQPDLANAERAMRDVVEHVRGVMESRAPATARVPA